MVGNTRLVFGGIALLGMLLLSAGSPALASNDQPGHGPDKSPVAPLSTSNTVDIGTAQAWVRLPDGTIQQVL